MYYGIAWEIVAIVFANRSNITFPLASTAKEIEETDKQSVSGCVGVKKTKKGITNFIAGDLITNQ